MESSYGTAPVPVWGKCTFNNKSYTCSCTLYSCSSSADTICDSCSHPKLVHKITGHLKFTPRVSPPSTQLSPQTDNTCDRRNFSADITTSLPKTLVHESIILNKKSYRLCLVVSQLFLLKDYQATANSEDLALKNEPGVWLDSVLNL